MKRLNRSILAVIILLLSLASCSNLAELGMTEFADAITNAINATNGNIQTAIVLDSPTNNQTFTNYTFSASGFAISEDTINQVFVFVRPEGSSASPDTYVASLLDTGTSLRPFTTAITVTLNTNYDIWAQVHDNSGNVVNSDSIMVNIDASGVGPTYPEISVYQGSTLIISGSTYTNDFGTVTKNTISTPITITISNTGDASLYISNVLVSSQFSNTAPQGYQIAAASSSTFEVFFRPNTSATHYSALNINNNDSDESPYRFYLVGTATNSTTPEPDLHVYYGTTEIPSGLSYTNYLGAILTNQTTAAHTFIISNAGNADLTNFSITDDSNEFSTENINTVLSAGAFTSFDVDFTPLTSGFKYSTISIDNSFISPFTFTVKGLGTNATTSPEPEILVYFNNTLINSGTSYTNDMGAWMTNQTSSPASFTISNIGSATLYISSINDTSTVFTTQNLNQGIPIGSSTTFDVTFNSGTAGTYHNEITIVNDDTNKNPYTFYTKAQATNATGGGQLSMSIDGTKDANWQNSFSISQSSTVAPLNITNFYVANDNNNLYIAFEGDNPIDSWNRNILVFYQIDDTPSAGTPSWPTESHFALNDTFDSNWKPTGAFFFKIGSSESWKGTFAHEVNAGGTGWDNVIVGDTGNHGISTDSKFIEAKFDLSSLSLSASQTIKFYIVITHQFDEYSTSTLPITYTPDDILTDIENHTPVTWTANYTIK